MLLDKQVRYIYILFLVGIISSAFLVSCAVGTYGTIVTPEMKQSIVKGKSTKAEVLNLIGNPDQIIDMGNNKEQLSFISSAIKTTGVSASSKNTEFWVLFNNNVVEDFGEQPTTKEPNYGL